MACHYPQCVAEGAAASYCDCPTQRWHPDCFAKHVAVSYMSWRLALGSLVARVLRWIEALIRNRQQMSGGPHAIAQAFYNDVSPEQHARSQFFSQALFCSECRQRYRVPPDTLAVLQPTASIRMTLAVYMMMGYLIADRLFVLPLLLLARLFCPEVSLLTLWLAWLFFPLSARNLASGVCYLLLLRLMGYFTAAPEYLICMALFIGAPFVVAWAVAYYRLQFPVLKIKDRIWISSDLRRHSNLLQRLFGACMEDFVWVSGPYVGDLDSSFNELFSSAPALPSEGAAPP